MCAKIVFFLPVVLFFLPLVRRTNNYFQPRNGVEDQVNSQWEAALSSILLDSTTETLQCLVLAQLYCFSKGDYARLLQYKSLAVGIVLRLGLNQSQKKFALGALDGEMRKRMFWCVHCLDRYCTPALGPFRNRFDLIFLQPQSLTPAQFLRSHARPPQTSLRR